MKSSGSVDDVSDCCYLPADVDHTFTRESRLCSVQVLTWLSAAMQELPCSDLLRKRWSLQLRRR